MFQHPPDVQRGGPQARSPVTQGGRLLLSRSQQDAAHCWAKHWNLQPMSCEPCHAAKVRPSTAPPSASMSKPRQLRFCLRTLPPKGRDHAARQPMLSLCSGLLPASTKGDTLGKIFALRVQENWPRPRRGIAQPTTLYATHNQGPLIPWIPPAWQVRHRFCLNYVCALDRVRSQTEAFLRVHRVCGKGSKKPPPTPRLHGRR